ncbi:MAG: PilN domain-containing protein [Rhodothermales bacterium]
MTWPFLNRTCAGLWISESAVCSVDLARGPGGLRGCGYEKELVAEGDLTSALRRLCERMDATPDRLITHLEDAYLWHALVYPPPGLDTSSLDTWVQAEADARLPEGLVLDALVLRWTRLQDAGGAPCIAVVAARPEAIAERVDLLREAGLDPWSIGSLPLEIGNAFAFSPVWVAGYSVVIRRAAGGDTVTWFECGAPIGVDEVFDDEQLERLVGARNGKPHPIAGVAIGRPMPNGMPTSPGQPLEPLIGHGLLDMEATPAAALAVAGLCPGLPSVNLLEPIQVQQVTNRIDRRDALQLGICVGALLLVLLAGALILRVAVERHLAARAHTAVSLEPAARRRARAAEALEVERQRTAQGLALIAGRSRLAGVLDRIGRGVPARVKLDAVSWEGGEVACVVSIQGRAADAAEVAGLIETLEQAEAGRQVQLRSAEAVGVGAERSVQFAIEAGINGCDRRGE